MSRMTRGKHMNSCRNVAGFVPTRPTRFTRPAAQIGVKITPAMGQGTVADLGKACVS